MPVPPPRGRLPAPNHRATASRTCRAERRWRPARADSRADGRACSGPRPARGPPGADGRPSVAAHRRVDRARPEIEPTGQVLHVLETVLLAQVLGDGGAAHT